MKRRNESSPAESLPKKPRILKAYPLTIRNTVHTAVIQHKFCLESIATALRGRYGAQMFPAASFRFVDPFVTLSVFEEGKVVITGTDDFVEALRAVHLLCRMLYTEMNIRVRFINFGRQNMVGSLALGYALDLPRLYTDFNKDRHKKVQFHETFPGLRYWPGEDERLPYDEKTIVLILFTSGAVVIAGAKSKASMLRTLDRALPKIAPYRLKQ